MIFDIGHLILLAALVLAAFGILGGYFGGQRRNTCLLYTSRCV